jgi:ADP-heptose:LPS heptosyltransferase
VSGAILAVRLRALGDVVLVTPALRALARASGGRSVEVVTESRYAPLLEGLEGISRVWPLERSAAGTFALARELRRRRYDVAVDFFGNPRSAQLVAASGAGLTAGYDLRGRRFAYQIRVPRDAPGEGGRREHASTAHLRLAAAVGGDADGLPPRVALSEPARARAAALLAEAGVRDPSSAIGLVAAGTWATKTWPLSHAAALARRLMAEGLALLLISGPGEEAASETLARLAPGLLRLPPCGVGELAATLARLRAVIGTDSGPRHLAAALDVPTFAWFGQTSPETWQPPGPLHGYWQTSLPCRACDRTVCPHWSCMPELAPADAAARVLAHLEGLRGQAPALRLAAGA